MTNLCENATKFGSSVRVELGASAGTATIDLADDGHGIPVEHRSRVLEPFYKVDAARGGTNVGFGLGLSIVAEIVQDHGGKTGAARSTSEWVDREDCNPDLTERELDSRTRAS